jgi:hypothetical protein
MNDILQIPSNHILIAMSQSGKTTILLKFFEELLKKKNSIFFAPFGQIIWICSKKQNIEDQDHKVVEFMNSVSKKKMGANYHSMLIIPCECIEEVEDMVFDYIEKNNKEGRNTGIVLDNLGFETNTSKLLTELFCFGRHKRVSVFNILHELFSNKQLKAQRGLTNYIWLGFVAGADVENWIESHYKKDERKHVMELYDKTQESPYGFLIIDLSARKGNPKRYEKRFRINDFFKPIKTNF